MAYKIIVTISALTFSKTQNLLQSPSQYSSTVLQTMATATRRSNSKLTIKVDNNLSSISMQTIATAGQGRVTFDLT